MMPVGGMQGLSTLQRVQGEEVGAKTKCRWLARGTGLGPGEVIDVPQPARCERRGTQAGLSADVTGQTRLCMSM